MHNYSKLSLLAAVAIISVGTVAHAANSGVENDAMTILSAKTSLVQAVTAAEQHVSGKATQAEYEHSKLFNDCVIECPMLGLSLRLQTWHTA